MKLTTKGFTQNVILKFFQDLRLVKTQGFTLIELLVVVLIIGILAAVAVPQNQKAVEKSRATEAVLFLHEIHHACQLYELAGNDCGDDHLLENMDVQLPGELTTEDCADVMCVNTKDWQYVDITGGEFRANRIINDDWENPLYSLTIQTASTSEYVGKIVCTGDFCQKLCGDNDCFID